MIDPSWNFEDFEPAAVTNGRPRSALVTLHFLGAALRRAWLVWTGLAVVGMLLGVAWTVVLPIRSVGTVTLLLAHDPADDATQAMLTDVSLLRSRTVATSVIRRLQLDVSPDEVEKVINATPTTSSLLTLTVTATDERSAVAWANALAASYLQFRNQQTQSQANALIKGYRERIAALQKRVDDLTAQYDTLSAQGPEAQGDAGDVLTVRTQLNGQIETLQQAMQDAALKSSAVVTASHVLDPATVVPAAPRRRLVLCAASGLIGGMALGAGLVVLTALASSRLRRREEVALAIDAPVRMSVSGLAFRERWSPAPRLSASSRDVQLLVRALESALAPRRARPARLTLGAVDNPRAAQLVLASLTAQLAARNLSVFAVDLGRRGGLTRSVKRALDHQRGQAASQIPTPVVYRPDGLPCLARGPIESPSELASDLQPGDPRRVAWDAADVVLVLDEIDPALGVDHLTSWSDRVVLLVTTGRSTAERLRTIAELIRSAGLHLQFAMLVGADTTDESVGLPEPVDAGREQTRETS